MIYWSYELDQKVAQRKFVPYGIPWDDRRYKVGSFYWCGYWSKYYKVLSVNGNYVTVLWQNRKETTHCTSLDAKRDYLLKPFEWKRDDSPVGKDVSLTFAEIRALCCAGVINEKDSNIIYNRYMSPGTIQPKGHVYYYIRKEYSNRDNGKYVYLDRDIIKSPRKER